MTFGRVQRVPIRTLWLHEEQDFSCWLEENLEVLGETLGFRLEPLERAKQVGSFRVDLVAGAESGDMVIIESQLNPSHHDHRGKLVTYFANLQATIAVRSVAAGRPERVIAVNWLNESTPDDQAFYLIHLEAVRIQDSLPAPLFTRLAGPTEESKAIGKEKKILGERHVGRREFWKEVLALAGEQGIAHHANRTPSKDPWIGAGAGGAGFMWCSQIWKSRGAGVELSIDNGDADANIAYFDELHRHRITIEQEFGAELDWPRLEGRRACRVRAVIECGGLQADRQFEWPRVRSRMVDAMDRLVRTLGPRIRELP